jgi:hypothetical protein
MSKWVFPALGGLFLLGLTGLISLFLILDTRINEARRETQSRQDAILLQVSDLKASNARLEEMVRRMREDIPETGAPNGKGR